MATTIQSVINFTKNVSQNLAKKHYKYRWQIEKFFRTVKQF